MKPIWHVPLLVLAGLTAIAGVAVTLAVGTHEPWPAVEWGLAGASLTFTSARIAHLRRVTRRELELVVVTAAVFVAFYLGVIALVLVVGAIGKLAFDEASAK